MSLSMKDAPAAWLASDGYAILQKICRTAERKAQDVVRCDAETGMVAQQMALERPTIFRRIMLVGTAPRGGEDIMHLEKPSLAKPLGDPSLQGRVG
jgi:hypothetical protein